VEGKNQDHPNKKKKTLAGTIVAREEKREPDLQTCRYRERDIPHFLPSAAGSPERMMPMLGRGKGRRCIQVIGREGSRQKKIDPRSKKKGEAADPQPSMWRERGKKEKASLTRILADKKNRPRTKKVQERPTIKKKGRPASRTAAGKRPLDDPLQGEGRDSPGKKKKRIRDHEALSFGRRKEKGASATRMQEEGGKKRKRSIALGENTAVRT